MTRPTFDQLEAAARLVALDHSFDFSVDEGGKLLLVVNANDLFGPAADCEEVPWDQVGEVAAMVAKCPEHGEIRWVMQRRGVNKVWRPERFDLDGCGRCRG